MATHFRHTEYAPRAGTHTHNGLLKRVCLHIIHIKCLSTSASVLLSCVQLNGAEIWHWECLWECKSGCEEHLWKIRLSRAVVGSENVGFWPLVDERDVNAHMCQCMMASWATQTKGHCDVTTVLIILWERRSHTTTRLFTIVYLLGYVFASCDFFLSFYDIWKVVMLKNIGSTYLL